MSDNIGSIAIDSGMVENVVLAIGMSVMSHSVPEKHSTSGLESAILNLGGRVTSANVGNVTYGSGVVENVGVAVGISVISHSILGIQFTSGLKSAILNSGSRPTSYSNRR